MKTHHLTTACLLLALASAHSKILYVSPDSTNPVGNFDSWETAAVDIQSAVGKSATGDTIYLGPGIHTLPPKPTAYPGTQTNVVYIESKAINFIGSTGDPADVIIDGEGKYRPLCIFRIYPASVRDPLVVANITFRNGKATTGGGIYTQGGEAELGRNDHIFRMENCVVESNTASSSGGGIHVAAAAGIYPYYSAIITDTIIRNNLVTNNNPNNNHVGGALRTDIINPQTSLRILNTLVHDNRAPSNGGLYLDKGVFTVANSVFRRNSAYKYHNASTGGGAIRFGQGYDAEIRNSLFVENDSNDSGYNSGGAIAVQSQLTDDRLEIRNCTFWGNAGHAVHQRTYEKSPFHDISFWNSIFHGNTPGDVVKQSITSSTNYWYNDASTNYFYNCLLSTTNLNYYHVYSNVVVGDPGFVDPEGGDFRLRGSSPAVGAGVYESWMDDASDLAGMPRITPGMGVDMGAYAFRPTGSLFIIR